MSSLGKNLICWTPKCPPKSIYSEESLDSPISSGLKANGYLVITAPDGYDGYVRAKKEAPNVIIANDLLPYVSGFKLSKLIKCDDRHADTKIIIMSNTTGSAIDKMFKQSNADKMLEKPFQLKDIMELLEENKKSNDDS